MQLAPSLLDADWQHIQSEIDSLKQATRIHLDIMDGHYVPNTSFRAEDIEPLIFPVPTEAHLMTDDPEMYFERFASLNIKGLTFHIENTGTEKALTLLPQLKKLHVRSGICIDGYTDPSALSDEILALSDQILVMSVKAGKGGQSFMPECLEKIAILRKRGFSGEIEVDGGINLETATKVRDAGADIIVVGSFLMKKPLLERQDLLEQFLAL